VELYPRKISDLKPLTLADRHFSPLPLAERLAGWALDEGERAARLGDLEERFQLLADERGEKRARIWYRWQVLGPHPKNSTFEWTSFQG